MMNKKEITIAAKAGLTKWAKNNNTDQEGIVEVYFESNGCAEMVATFIDEETYIKCLPTLELLAKENNCIITESIN